MRLRGLRLLLVEDENTLRELYADTLRDAGAEVWGAASGQEALSLLSEREHLDAVLSDMRMSNGNGIFLMQECHRRFPQLCFVLVTGCSDQEIAEAKAQGVAAVLMKPFPLRTLVDVVARLNKKTA